MNLKTMKNSDLSCEGLEINKTLLATREHYITASTTLIREPVKLLLFEVCNIYSICSSKDLYSILYKSLVVVNTYNCQD